MIIQSRVMRRHTEGVITVAFSPCGNFGYSGGYDNRLVMWDMRTGDVVSERTDVHVKAVGRMAAAASGTFIVTCDPHDNRVMVWHAKTLAPMQTLLEGNERGVLGLAVSPDSTMIISGDVGGVVRVWEVQGEGGRCKVKRTINDHTGPVTAVALSPDGEMLATCSHDTTIKVYSITNDFSLMHTLEGHKKNVNSVSFSPDSSRLCSSADKSINLWEPLGGALLRTLNNAHADYRVHRIAWSPVGNLIASASWGARIKLWGGFSNMEPLHTYALENGTNSIEFHPSGPFLLVAAHNGSVHLKKIALLEHFYNCREMRKLILGAFTRFEKAVHKAKGEEKDKVAAVKATFPKTAAQLKKVCGSCKSKKKKLRACGGCKSVYYCSVKCQHDVWEKHKVECKRIRKQNKRTMKTKDFGKVEIEAGEMLSAMMRGGGLKGGVLWEVLKWMCE